MRSRILMAALLGAGVASAAGCDLAESPLGEAGEDRVVTRQDLAEKRLQEEKAGGDADAAFEVARKRIESQYEAALQDCEARAGAAGDRCREAADAQREAALEQAEDQRARARM